MATAADTGRDALSHLHAGIADATNDRQASKILDAKTAATLHLQHESNRDGYLWNGPDGLFFCGFGSGGGLYYCDSITPTEARGVIRSADEYVVIHESDALPTPVAERVFG